MDTSLLIFRVLSGQATVAEQETLQEWMKKDDDVRASFEDLKMLWNYRHDHSESNPNYNEVLKKIKSRFRERQRRKSRTKSILWIGSLIAITFVTGAIMPRALPDSARSRHIVLAQRLVNFNASALSGGIPKSSTVH